VNERDSRANELAQIGELHRKAVGYAQADPEVALALTRKVAEGICRFVFADRIGEPGRIMLDQLVQKLSAAGLLPPHVTVPLNAIRDFGNYGAHAQSGGHRIDSAYVAPAMAALETVFAWFTTAYLDPRSADAVRAGGAAAAPGTGTASPAGGAPPTRRRATRAVVLAIAAVAALAVAGGALLNDRSRRSPPPPGVPAPASSGATAPSGAEPPDASSPLRLDLVVKAAPPSVDEFRVVGPNEQLATGTRVLFEVRVSRAAHVYLAQRSSASRSVTPLFPNSAIAVTNPIPAGAWIRIPARESFVLDDQDIGTEAVLALASLQPVTTLDEALPTGPGRPRDARRVEAALASAALSNRPGCAGTRGLQLEGGDCEVRTRGLELPASDPGARPVASARVRAAPGDGTVVVPFSFRHVRAR
jgi:hypothetical protein